MQGTASRSRSDRVCIVGLGAVGSLIGFFIHSYTGKPVVFLVRRRGQAEVVNDRGVMLGGLLSARYPAEARTQLGRGECDYVIVATKAHDAVGLIPRLAGLGGVIVVSSNGFGALERCVSAKAPCLGMVVDYGVTRLDDYRFEVRGLGRLVIGPPRSGAPLEAAEELGSILSLGGARVEVVEDVTPYRWLKASVNASLNPVTALLGGPNGIILEDPDARETATQASREAGRIAEALGVELPRDPVEYLIEVAEKTRSNKSSMLQDLEACRPTEIDWINGYMTVVAGELGVEAPVIRVLHRLVKAKERAVLSKCGSGESLTAG